jgi:serine O-acetyltransferase
MTFAVSMPRVEAEPASGRASPDHPLHRGDVDRNPEGIGFLELLAEDFRTHGGVLGSAGFWSLAAHRFGNWRMRIKPKLLRAPFSFVYQFAHFGCVTLWGIDLPYNAKIGRRFLISHHGAVLIGSWEIGDDVHVRHSTTIGLKRRTENRPPRIGSRVEIGAGACIVGDIRVGDDCFIGANTVLATDLPDGSAVLGVPARKLDLAAYTSGSPK